MNQKQKMIIGLTSLFCGSPIVFLSLKGNNNRPKNNKNNSSIVNLQKKEKKKEKQQKSSSSSFLLWTVLIIITVVILVIIFRIIYKYRQKLKKSTTVTTSLKKNDKPQTEKTLEQQINNLLEQKRSLKCGIMINNFSIEIIFSKNSDATSAVTINKILKEDITNQQPLPEVKNTDFYPSVPAKDLQTLLEAMVNFLRTYLTSKLLEEVYQDYTQFIRYEILTNIAIAFAATKNTEQIILSPNIREIGIQEATKDDLEKIEKNQHLDLLKKVLKRNQSTFIKNKESNEIRYLFLNSFRLYYLLNNLYQSLLIFYGKNNATYADTLKKIQNDKEELDNLIFKKN